jgi:hypothetical protein
MSDYGRQEPVTAQYGVYDDAVPRRRHWGRRIGIGLVILVVVLVGLDFGARAFAENEAATQMQQQGFPKKPNVSIKGFPFLTQVIARDFSDIQISSTDITEGPLEIASINATLNGVHVNTSFQNGTIDHLNGTIDVTFPALANAMTSQDGGLASALGGAGLSLTQAGPNEVKTSFDLVVVSGSAVWRVTTTGHNNINIDLVSTSGDLPSSLLGSIGDINIPLPSLPVKLSIQSISVTPSGLVGTVTAQDVKFSNG